MTKYIWEGINNRDTSSLSSPQVTAYISKRTGPPYEPQYQEYVSLHFNPHQAKTRYAQTHLPNIRDVINILPEFDNLDQKSLNSEQFINRIDNLKEVPEHYYNQMVAMGRKVG